VVIGIIALLISILLPSLARAREQGNAIKCASNLRQLGMAMVQYTNNNKGYFPYGSRYPNTLARNEDWIWYQETALPPGRPIADLEQSAIAPYMGKPLPKEIFRCPSDDVQGHTAPTSGYEPYKFSYVMNQNFESGYFPPNHPGRPVVVTQIRNPTRKIILAEEDEGSINDGLWAPGNGDVDTDGAAKDLLAIRHDRKKAYPDDRAQVVGQHANADRRGNASFVDGHAEFIARRDAHDKTAILWDK